MKLSMIPRKMSISMDKTKVPPATLQQLGWTLRDKNWEKIVPMPLWGKPNEKTAGGVPDYSGATQDDLLEYVNDLVEGKYVTVDELMGAILNGVYLAFNSKEKPTESTSFDAKMAVFTVQNCPLVNGQPVPTAAFVQYLGLMATPTQSKAFVEKWFEAYKPA